MEDKNLIINRIIILLYSIVTFIPILQAHDIVNTQWFYIAIVNTISLGYIFLRRKSYELYSISKLALAVFIGSILFLFFSLLSITKSILISESIVALIYLVLVLVALFILYIIVKQNPKKYFNFFALLIGIVAVIDSLHVIIFFISHNNEVRSEELISSLTHNYGNRNILATSIAMKFPFLLYIFAKKSKIYKILSLLGLIIVFVAIFLIGTRTAIYASIILFVLFLFYLIYVNQLNKIIPLIIIGIISILTSLNLNKIEKGKLNYFNDLIFTKTKKDIFNKAKNDSLKINLLNDSGRIKFWNAAIQDIKINPLLGVGIGNWKLTPKNELIKTSTQKNFYYPKKVHNDFLQVFSEIGIFGFLLYFIFFIFIFFQLINAFLKSKKQSKEEKLLVIIVLFSSLSIYFFDSFFNFPHERTPIQILFYSILAFVLVLPSNKINFKLGRFPLLISILLLNILFLLISFKNYEASKVHKILYDDFSNKDFFKEKYTISYNEMLEILPDFPEIDAYGRTISIMKSFYAYNSKRKNKTMQHLTEGIKKTPFHAESMGLKSMFFYIDNDLKNVDSALYYAKKSFDIQPSRKQEFEILRRIYVTNKDTLNTLKTLNTHLRVVPNDVDAWIQKAKLLITYNKRSKRFFEVIDSAYLLNPNNKILKQYKKK